MAIIDYSQPISVLLRESTKQAHDNVEHSAGAEALLKGLIPKDEYVRFLMMLWEVYDTFERALERHSTNPVLEPTYNPQLLARSAALADDISHLLDVPLSSWQQHGIYTALKANPPTALTAYTSRIEAISNSQDPSALLAHSYVRYLGDLSGGQSIKRVLAKAYGLDEGSAGGLTFFAFKQSGSSKAASLGDMKRIKEWFRAGMDKGVGDDTRIKESVVTEANLVFSLNKGLFDSIDLQGPKVVSAQSSGYSIASVASVILAVGIAHFCLVVGGFTGDRGHGKLVGVFEWIDNTFKGVSG